MALNVTTQVVQAVPVGVSTVVRALLATRLGFYIECQELNTDWWVTFAAVAAAENVGIYRRGRGRVDLDDIGLQTLGATNSYQGPIQVFVKAAAGITTVNFWIVEIE